MSAYTAEYLKKFGMEVPEFGTPCKECGHKWNAHTNATCPKDPKKPVPSPIASTWDLAVEETSLSGNPTPYRRGHVRVVSKQLRLQGRNPSTGKDWEDTSHGISGSLVQYISGREHTCPSIAGTGTMYAQCRFRRIGAQSVRVQIAGPEFNRPWGIEFDLSHMIHAPAYIGKEPSPPPATPKEPKVGDVFLNTSGNECHIQTVEHGQITGHNKAMDNPFVISVVGYVQLLKNGTYKLKPTSTMSEVGFLATFGVGDKVVVVVRGDGCGKNTLTDGCTGGPKVGTLATVKAIGQFYSCGSVKIDHGDGDTWSCTPAHLAHYGGETIDTAAGHLEPTDEVPF